MRADVQYVVFILGLSAFTAVGEAQAPAADLELSSISVGNPLHLDEPNGISVVVTNRGAVPLRADIVIEVFNEESTAPTILFSAATEDAFSGSRTFSTIWSGRVWDAATQEQLPLDGPLTVRGTVKPRDTAEDSFPQNDVRDAARNLASHVVTVSVSPSPPTYEMAPGETWEGVIRLEQSGDLDGHPLNEQVRLSAADGTPGWTFSFESDLVDLPALDRVKQVRLFMKAPQDAPATQIGTVNVVASPTDAPRSSATAEATSPPVYGTGRLAVTMPISDETASPTETVGAGVSFPVHVDNLQNREDNIQLVFVEGQQAGTGLQPRAFPLTQTTPSMGRASFDVRIEVPSESQAGSYAWTVRAVSTFTNVAPADAPQPFILSVTPWHKVDVIVDEATQDVEPGDAAPIEFTIANLGNGPDTFRLVPLQIPATWTIQGPATVDAGAGEIVKQTWSLLIPGNQPPNVVPLRFRIESVHESSAQDTAIDSVRVLASAIPQMTVPHDATPIEEGGTAQFTIIAANVGNLESEFEIQVAIRDDPDETNPPAEQWVVTRNAHTVLLEPGATRAVTVTIEAPSPLEPTDGIAFDLRMTSVEEPARSHEIRLRAFPAVPDLVLIGLGPTPNPAYERHPAVFEFKAVNAGTRQTDGPVRVRVAFLEEGRSTTLATHEIELPALDWKTDERAALFNVSVPTDRGLGELRVKATVDPGDLIREHEEENNEFVETLHLRRFDVRIHTPGEQSGEPGETIEFVSGTAFRVENVGPEAENVTFSIRSSPLWVNVTANFTPLAPNAPSPLPVVFQIPAEPEIQDVLVIARAEHTALDDQFLEELLHVRIRDSTPPNITSAASNVSVLDRDGVVQFSAQVKDALGIRQVKLFIVSPTGTVESLPMPETSPDVFAIEKRFLAAGTYSWYVWAEDSSLARNSGETSASAKTIVVRSGGPPRLHLISPANNSIIRPGTTIVMSVLSGASLASANYWLDDQVFPLPLANPLQIPTRGWSDGLSTLRVQVWDQTNQTGKIHPNFTLDGTPPSVSNFGLTPQNPNPGDEVNFTVHIQDQSPVSNASLRLSFLNGRTEHLELMSFGENYSAAFTYQADLETLSVVAEDVAGNRGSGERTLLGLVGKPLETSRGSSPGPSSVAVFLASFVVLVVGMRGHGRRR